MPIQYSDGEIVLIFGTGDIAVKTAYLNDDPFQIEKELVFHQQVPRPIGVPFDDDNGKPITPDMRPIRLHFDSIIAIDVLRDALDRVRDSLMTRGTGRVYDINTGL